MKKLPRYLVDFDLDKLPKVETAAVIIGSGVAGISAAYHLGKHLPVVILTKTELSLTATRFAQGGIAAAVGLGDSPESHFRDTIEAGRGLCDEEAVRVLVTEGPAEIETLREIGAVFDMEGNNLSLTREAGHSRARVVHSRDTTGGEVEAALAATVKGMPNIRIIERAFAVDVLTDGNQAFGALALLEGKLTAFIAPVVIIAAGGMGQLYAVTTNPSISTGDGKAMGFRAGCELTDVEFVQFHPTALHVPTLPRFLISEAVRGEGAYLVDDQGERFMVGRHPLAELAPRDIVVREEITRMRDTATDHLYLDCRHIGRKFMSQRFPAIFKELVSHGLDVDKDLIPVSPAAHYMSGGIKTDLAGRTGLDGLFAVGEAACTGVHGANRLASNSLLEGLVFSRRAAAAALSIAAADKPKAKSPMHFATNVPTAPGKEARALIAELKNVMQADAAVVRTRAGLDRVLSFIAKYGLYLKPTGPWSDDYELANLLTTGLVIATAAKTRTESRGSHWREDYPDEDDARWLKHILLSKGDDGWVSQKTT